MTIIPGGLWFKDNCLKITPNTNTSGVRYRYPGEDWVEVDGDDYTLEDNVKGQCSGSYYQIFTNDAQQYDYDGSPLPGNNHFIVIRFGPVERVLNPSNPFTFEKIPAENLPYQAVWDAHYQKAVVKYIDLNGNEKQGEYIGNGVGFDGSQPNNVSLTRLRRVGYTSQYIVVEDDDCGTCDLTITKDGNIVHTESRKECPEVEILGDDNCEEDEPVRIEIQTTPLGFIDVTKTAASQDGQPEAAIPDECVNIYKVDAIHQLLAPSGALPDIIYTFIGQYCSTPGCEPPTVVRDGDQCGESCPDDTCAVSCSDHICCHDGNGVAVQEIPLENYAGGN